MSETARPPFPKPILKLWFWRILPIWIGIGLIIFLMQIAVCGILHDNERVRLFLKWLEVMPIGIIKSALGGAALESGNVSALIAIGYQHPFVLFLFMLYAVGVPTSLLTSEVTRGTMELVLSRPITKTQIYICALALTLVGMFGLAIMMFFGTFVAVRIFDFGEPIDMYLFFRLATSAGLLASTVGGIALFFSALCRQLYMAVAAPVALLMSNYFVSIMADYWPRMNFLRPYTLFHYVSGPELAKGWPLEKLSVLIVVLAIAVLSGGIVWSRRDLYL